MPLFSKVYQKEGVEFLLLLGRLFENGMFENLDPDTTAVIMDELNWEYVTDPYSTLDQVRTTSMTVEFRIKHRPMGDRKWDSDIIEGVATDVTDQRHISSPARILPERVAISEDGSPSSPGSSS